MKQSNKLPRSFYTGDDVLIIAKQLLGKTLCTNINQQLTKATITEVEAYCGRTDEGCHAYPNRRTKRTEVMYGQGGFAYVYICYGIHTMLNIVTNKQGLANCILIRAVKPIEGKEYAQKRRGLKKYNYKIATGPGCVGQAMGIDINHYGADLCSNVIWLEDAPKLKKNDVGISQRIGMNFDGPDKYLPWRFFIKNNQWVSKLRASDKIPNN